jgi:hypothetical protein
MNTTPGQWSAIERRAQGLWVITTYTQDGRFIHTRTRPTEAAVRRLARRWRAPVYARTAL